MSQKWIYKTEPVEEIVDGLISSIGFGTLESKKGCRSHQGYGLAYLK